MIEPDSADAFSLGVCRSRIHNRGFPPRGRSLRSGYRTRLEKYVKSIVSAFKDDERIWVWDLYNEPSVSAEEGKAVLVEKVFQWAREINPSQPLTVGKWDDTAHLNQVIYRNSDIITFHDYQPVDALATQITELKKQGRPIINTEWLARGAGSVVDSCLPLFAEENVGCMHWGLVNGRTQTDLHWGWRPGKGEPEIWQHDLYHENHKPYDIKELELFRNIIAKQVE